MDQERELFADNLTREVFRVNGQLYNKIDIFMNNPALFGRLVHKGAINRDEAFFLNKHSSEFKRIYSIYSNVNNRKLFCKNYIVKHKETYRIFDLTLSDNQTSNQLINNKSEIEDASYYVATEKIDCYVVGKKNKKCRLCHQTAVPVTVKIYSEGRSSTIHMRKCPKCGHFTVSYPTYKDTEIFLSCSNPEDLNQLKYQFEKKKKRKIPKVVLPTIKQPVEPRLYTYCRLKLYDVSSKKEIMVFVRDADKSELETKMWVLTNRSSAGIECFKAIANGVDRIKLDNIDYIIRDVEVFDAKYIKRYKDDAYYFKHTNINNKNPQIVDFGSDYVDVHVYFKLSNSCLNLQHPIESVTMRSINRQTGKRYQVNAYYCSKCRKYFINHEAVKGLIDRNMYPAFHYVIADHYDGELKPMSQLMLYGYSARANGPSAVTRHNILKWVIDSGLMSKPEIIKDLQFKIAYNGKRPGNEAARDKWEDDLDFLNYYVEDNTRVIKGRLRR